MATRTHVEATLDRAGGRTWGRLRRVTFRFFVLYLTLYALATQIAGGLIMLPGFSLPNLAAIPPTRDFTLWLATRIFHVAPPLVYTGNSGDTAFHWIQTLWLLAAAAILTAVWSAVASSAADYSRLHAWFRTAVRFALAAQMFYFGMAKVIPTQFPAPSLSTLVEPVGNLSLTELLWTAIGASPAYQMFTGWAEVLAGCLLVLPQTARLGAVVALADMIQVFALNMTYDIGLKQLSFHLIVLALFLLAPDLRWLTDVFVRGRSATAPPERPLLASPRAHRRSIAVQIAYGVYLLAMFTRLAFGFRTGPGGGGAPKSALYGIWTVDRLAVDGRADSPSSNDYDRRWRRVIFDAPDAMVFQRTDDSFARYGAAIDAGARAIVLRKGNSRYWSARFRFERPDPERLVLDGEMDGHAIHAELENVPLDTFRLLNSTFRWVRPPDPYGG